MTSALYVHPRIRTLADDRHIDGAIAVRHGRIAHVGTLSEAREALGRSVDEFELPGETVIPAFHDAHIHCGNLAREMVAPDLRDAGSHGDVIARLRDYRLAEGGTWVVGGRWDRNAWSDRTAPHRSDLDAIFGDVPVSMPSVDGHANWANSAALRLAGIDSSTPDPAGGRIERDEHGEPTGILLESAATRVRRIAEASLDAQLPALMRTVQRRLLEAGIGHVTDLDGEDVRSALLAMHSRGELVMRVHKGVQAKAMPIAIAEGRRTGEGDDVFTNGPAKFFADGALGPRSALMHAAYEGSADSGIAVTEADALLDGVRTANEHGIAAAVHAIGDLANSTVLDVFEAVAETARAGGLRNRIEHAQHLRPSDISRFAKLGVIPSQQPVHATTDFPLSVQLLGDRATAHYPWRSLLDSGATLAFGSDAPVEPINPFYGVHAAVTRKTRADAPDGGREPDERLSVLEALRAFTAGPAYAAGLEASAGSLAVGMHADFIAVDQDPFTMSGDDLWKAKTLTTIVAGSIAHTTAS